MVAPSAEASAPGASRFRPAGGCARCGDGRPSHGNGGPRVASAAKAARSRPAVVAMVITTRATTSWTGLRCVR